MCNWDKFPQFFTDRVHVRPVRQNMIIGTRSLCSSNYNAGGCDGSLVRTLNVFPRLRLHCENERQYFSRRETGPGLTRKVANGYLVTGGSIVLTVFSYSGIAIGPALQGGLKGRQNSTLGTADGQEIMGAVKSPN